MSSSKNKHIVNSKRCFDAIYKSIAHYNYCECECDNDDRRKRTLNGSEKELKIALGHIIPHSRNDLTRLWMFREHFEEKDFTNRIELFEILCNTVKDGISKDTISQKIYIFDGWRCKIDNNSKQSIVHKNVETDYLADFRCQGQDIDIRFTSECYTTALTNTSTLALYDSIHEQHITRYTFHDAIHVDFIVEFDVTRPKDKQNVLNSRINRIHVNIDKHLSFSDKESSQLFEQILDLLVFCHIPDQCMHTYNILRKFCDK